MGVSNHEGSVFWFPQASGFFTHDLAGRPDLGNAGGQLNGVGQWPSGYIMAQALQSVSITPRITSENLVVVGNAGIGGRNFSVSEVDVEIQAVVTSGRRMGKTLAHMVPTLSGLEVITTDGLSGPNGANSFGPVAGRKAHVSGLSITSLSWNFQANGHASFQMNLIGDGVTWTIPTTPQGMDIDLEHVPATCDLFRIQYGQTNVLVSGLQAASIAATFSRQPVFQLGQILPFGAENQVSRPVTWPPEVKVSMTALSNHTVLRNWLEKFQTTYDPQDVNKSVTVSVLEQGSPGTRNWIVCSGLVPTQATLGLATNSFSNYQLEFEGHELEF